MGILCGMGGYSTEPVGNLGADSAGIKPGILQPTGNDFDQGIGQLVKTGLHRANFGGGPNIQVKLFFFDNPSPVAN